MQDVSTLLKNGISMWNVGNPKQALKLFDAVLAIEPKNPEALLRKGNVLGKLARYKQAILCYDMVLQHDNKNLLAILNKGLAHHYIGEYDIAISCYDNVLSERPENITALYNKASSLVKSNRIEEGIEILSKVAKKDFSYRAKAKFDDDFVEIRNLNKFKDIVL